MFIWQPPHFWALALLRKDEYRQAKLPMLPVTHGDQATKNRMLLYTIALIPTSLAMYWLELVGPLYLVLASILGIAYLVLTIDFFRKPVTHKSSRKLFGFSILYLLGLFTLIFIDCQCGNTLT